MNRVELIGRLARDPEVRYTQTQKAVCKFTIAVDRIGEGADFIRVQVWDKLAQNCEQYLGKGSLVGIEGRIVTGSYEKDGHKVSTFEIRADRVEFLSRKETTVEDTVQETFAAIEEDVPF